MTVDVMKLLQTSPDEVRWVLKEKYHYSRQQAIETVENLRLHPDKTTAALPNSISQDFAQLLNDVPVGYVIGFVKFLDCHIDLTLRPLIPRPETEEWVGKFINELKTGDDAGSELRVLDLCCGSGCIGIAVLKHLPKAKVTFVDIDPQMLTQTKMNVKFNNISEERCTFIESDLFSGVEGKFDAILANPPYVNPFGEISPSLRHEPERALFAQKSGFALVEQSILNVKNHFNQDGKLWIEFEVDQAERVQQVANSIGLNVRVFQDQFGRDRYAILG